jgi:hypothetical protein
MREEGAEDPASPQRGAAHRGAEGVLDRSQHTVVGDVTAAVGVAAHVVASHDGGDPAAVRVRAEGVVGAAVVSGQHEEANRPQLA